MRCISQATLPVTTALSAGLTDGYAWHQAIWESFPGCPDAKRKFLFRTDRRETFFRVLLLSEEAPSPTQWLAWQSKIVPDAFLEHGAYQFQIKANPTMRRSSDKRRLGIFDEDRLREWIMRKASASGFEIEPETLAVGAPMPESFVKNGRMGKHIAVDYEGVLRVVDREAFVKTFQNGIGSAKGFGYGLLMLQPMSR